MKAMPTDKRPYLARAIARLRRQAGLIQNELALLADTSRQGVSLIVEGQRQRRRRDDPWENLEEAPLPAGPLQSPVGNERAARASKRK
jgi:hypothetical protein